MKSDKTTPMTAKQIAQFAKLGLPLPPLGMTIHEANKVVNEFLSRPLLKLADVRSPNYDKNLAKTSKHLPVSDNCQPCAVCGEMLIFANEKPKWRFEEGEFPVGYNCRRILLEHTRG